MKYLKTACVKYNLSKYMYVDCISVYSASNRDSGDVDVALTPGKTYYLEFHNPGFLAFLLA